MAYGSFGDEGEDYPRYLALLRECYPSFELRSWRPVQQGWDSVTLLVNEELIARFARRPDVSVRLAREARLLPDLADALPVAIPRFTYVCGDPNTPASVRFVGYPALPGVALTSDSISSPQHREKLAGQLGEFLSALHAYPIGAAQAVGVLGGTSEDWRQEYADFYAEIREHIFPLLSSLEQRAVADVWEGYLNTQANFAFIPTLIHRDLGGEHILHEPASGQLTGIIDWGDASIGDPAQDFTGIARQLGHDFAARVLASYMRPTDARFWERVSFYGRIIPFHEIRFGQYEHDDAHITAGLAALRAQIHAR